MSASSDPQSPTWCAVCGVPGLDGARFCGHCGSRLHRRCGSCLSLVAPELAFCPMCGASVGGDEPLRLPLAREERRTVTILFADLIGFTALGERLDPEDLRRAQQDYFGVVRRVVESYGGVVEKYIGDAVMAVFGAPVAHENDPFRAVRAALELPKVLAGRSVGGQPLRVRLGVATGEAVVDLAAVGDRGQALVAGDVVNVAARLQAAAPPGGVLVTAATRRATRGTIDYAEHDKVTLAGKAEPVEVWLARRASASRVAAEHDDDSALAGRDSELDVLEATLRRSLAERRTQLVSLIGAPGLGKSRLVRELRARADADPAAWATWLSGRCLPYGEGVTYWALGEIVKSAAGIRETDDAAAARERLDTFLAGLVGGTPAPVTGGVAGGAADVRALRAALEPLVGLPTGQLSAEEAHAGWRRVLLLLAGQAPLVLVVEDLHWADESLLRFLESLVAEAAELPLLVLATMRPELLERVTGWAGGLRNSTTIELGPLPDAPMAALFGDLLGRRAFPADTLQRLVSLAGGNPLYAEEYVRMLADSGLLRRDGGPGMEIAAAEVPMPDSVQGVIASRLDLLGPAEQAVLAAASVVGETVWTGAVAATGGLPRPTTEQGLTDLSRRDLVRGRLESTVAGEAEWSFRHILVRDIAYARLPRGQRVELHRHCADWLESLPASRGEDLAELRAHHRDSAFQLARTLGLDLDPYAAPARRALVTAAVRAQRLHAVDAAAGFVARALADWPEGDDAADRLRAELLQAELAAVTALDDFVEQSGPEQVRGLAGRALALGERVSAAKAWTLLAQVELMRTDRRGALDALHEALGLFAGEPDSEDKAAAYATLARLQMVDGDTAPAIAAADRARAIAHDLGLLEIEANALVTAGAARFIGGDRAGIDEMERALEMCRVHGLRALGRACTNLATAMQELGDMRRCYELLDEAATVAASGGLSMVARFSDAAMRATFAGDWDATLAAADEFLRDAAAGTADWDVQVVAMCAWLRVLRDEDPGDRVEQALAVARQTGFHDLLCAALAHGALCRALQGRQGEALALLDELHEVRVRHDAGPSREWAAAAVAAATLAGGDRLAPLAAWLQDHPRRTPWVDAASVSARAGLAEQHGDLRAAAALHLDAAARYDAIGNATDAALGRAEAARLLLAVGDDEAAKEPLESTVDFARRNSAWRLVPARPEPAGEALEA